MVRERGEFMLMGGVFKRERVRLMRKWVDGCQTGFRRKHDEGK